MRAEPSAATGGILVGFASVQFGVVVVLGTTLLRDGLSVVAMLAMRFSVVAVALWTFSAVARRPLLPAAGERARLAMLGIVGYSIEASLFFAAINYGTATAVTLLFFTYPVFVTITSMLLGERAPQRTVAFALATAIAGAAIVVVAGGTVSIRPAGIALALGAAAMFTLYLIGVDRTMKRTDPLTASWWIGAWAALGLFASMLIVPGRNLPLAADEWMRLGLMGVGTAGAFVCLMTGLRHLGPVRTSIVAAAEPLSSAILSVIFLHEPLRAGTAAGGVMILAAAITASLARRPHYPDIELP